MGGNAIASERLYPKQISLRKPYNRPVYGEVAEWLKALAWKACIPKGIEGSNPSLTAILKTAPSGRFFYGGEGRVRPLAGFDRSSGTIGTAAGAPQGQGTWMCPGISLPHRHIKNRP